MNLAPFITLIDSALAMAKSRLAEKPGTAVYIHAQEELERIRGLAVMAERVPVTTTDIGLMAAKELDTSDPAFAAYLYDIAYAVNPAAD